MSAPDTSIKSDTLAARGLLNQSRAARARGRPTRAAGAVVDDVRRYKPAPQVYHHAARTCHPTWLNLVRSWLALDLLKSAAKVCRVGGRQL